MGKRAERVARRERLDGRDFDIQSAMRMLWAWMVKNAGASSDTSPFNVCHDHGLHCAIAPVTACRTCGVAKAYVQLATAEAEHEYMGPKRAWGQKVGDLRRQFQQLWRDLKESQATYWRDLEEHERKQRIELGLPAPYTLGQSRWLARTQKAAETFERELALAERSALRCVVADPPPHGSRLPRRLLTSVEIILWQHGFRDRQIAELIDDGVRNAAAAAERVEDRRKLYLRRLREEEHRRARAEKRELLRRRHVMAVLGNKAPGGFSLSSPS